MFGAPGSPRWIGVSWMLFSWTYVAMVGLGPAVFSVPGAAVASLVSVVFDAVADSWVFSDSEPQPTKTTPKATVVIATPLIAVVFFIKYS